MYLIEVPPQLYIILYYLKSRQIRPAAEQATFDRICLHIATSGDAGSECTGLHAGRGSCGVCGRCVQQSQIMCVLRVTQRMPLHTSGTMSCT